MMWDFQVPVVAVFTKFDQFRRNIRMELEDEGCDPGMDLNTEVENIFNRCYRPALMDLPRSFVWRVRVMMLVTDVECMQQQA